MKINLKNREKIESVLDQVQHRAKTRTISYEDIYETIERIEQRLELRLLKEDWRGLKFNVDLGAQRFPEAYRGKPMSTQFQVERGSKAWFVTNISRAGCHRSVNHEVEPDFTACDPQAFVRKASFGASW